MNFHSAAFFGLVKLSKKLLFTLLNSFLRQVLKGTQVLLFKVIYKHVQVFLKLKSVFSFL